MSDGSETADSALFQRARQGDRLAFGELIERHKDGLVNYLTRLCGSCDRAEDLAQEAFLRLYERGGNYHERGRLRSYLYRIATNLYCSQMRREQSWRRLGQLWFSANGHETEPAQQTNLLRDELGRHLASALLELPVRYRTPIILSLLEGWSHRQIAALMHCREGTVKSRIHRGRQILQQHLEEYRNGVTP